MSTETKSVAGEELCQLHAWSECCCTCDYRARLRNANCDIKYVCVAPWYVSNTDFVLACGTHGLCELHTDK